MMNLSIRTKSVLIAIVVMSATIAAIVGITSYEFQQSYREAMQSRSMAIGTSLKLQLQRLLQLGLKLDDLTGFEDECQDIVKSYDGISYAMVVGGNGKIVFHNDPSFEGKSVSDPAILDALKNHEEAVILSSGTAKKYYVAILPVTDATKSYVASVIVGYPVSLIAAKTSEMATFGLATGMFFLFVAVLVLLVVLSRLVTRPLSMLVANIREIASDGSDIGRRVAVQTGDEVGILAAAFNDMLGRIDERDKELEHHREHLEEVVAKRTTMLTEAEHLAHLGSWEWDIVNNHTSWSEEMYHIFGLDPRRFEATYEAFLQTVHPDDRKLVDTKVREALEQHQPYDIEYRVQSQGGKVHYIYAQGEVTFDQEGHPVRMQGTVQDITEDKLIHAELEKEHSLLQNIVESVPIRIFWKDHESRYLGCNTLFAKDAGLSHPNELIGKSDFDMGWKKEAELYRADDRNVMDSGVPKIGYEETQTTPDGKTIWVRTSKVPLHNAEQEVIGILGIYNDITDRRKAEQSLKLFRQLIDQSNDAIEVVDLRTMQYIDVNEKACQDSGYTREELLTMSVMDIDPTVDQSVNGSVSRQIRETGSARFETVHRRKDGSIYPVEITLKQIELDKIYVVAIVRDITERKQAMQALEESERKFRAILDATVDGILVADAKEHKFVTANRAICAMLGYEPEELYKLGIDDIHPVEVIPEAHQKFERQLKGELRGAMDLPVKRKDGSLFFADVSTSPLDLAGKHFLVGVFHDVTERKEVEEKVRKLNEELEEKVKERTKQLLDAQEELVRKEKLSVLGQVAGSVGHELRNPLGVMNNAVYFLQTVLSDADQTTREYLGIIKDEIGNADRIVSDLLDSVRTKPPQLQYANVSDLIEDTLAKCTIPDTVSVIKNIPAEPVTVKVDPLQMHQVFRNLITNGIEAMAEGGKLEITASENADARTVSVSVRDQGTGISSENMAKLFHPLYTSKPRGVGLGLMVVKNLTQANGGKVDVQSELGRGTVFTITLPLASVTDEMAVAKEVP